MTKNSICIPAVEQQHCGSRMHAFITTLQNNFEKIYCMRVFVTKKNHSLLAVIFFWRVCFHAVIIALKSVI